VTTMAPERTEAEIAAWKAGDAERNERARRERLRADGARSPSENLAGVDHVVIGGFAMISHGVLRSSKVLEICPAGDRPNMVRLAGCLSDLAPVQLGTAEVDGRFDPTSADDLAQGGNFRLRTTLGHLDVLQWVSGVDGEHAYDVLSADAVDAEVEGCPCASPRSSSCAR
jgi:hypothetical protein